jgi:predicted transcriptional regulator
MQLPEERNVPNDSAKDLTGLTAGIVAAYVSNHVVPTTDIAGLISNIHAALASTSSVSQYAASEVVDKQKPAVAIRKSVKDNEITCLECGANFKSLKRHLMTHHNLSPEGYRSKWELSGDYPMVAREYSEARSNLAKTMGLGQKRSRVKSAGRKTAA